jgi:hypothetical protein
MQHAERTAQADWQQLQQQLQHQDGSSDLPHAASWAAHDSQLSPRTAAAAVAYGRDSSSYAQQQQHVMQEPSLASGLGLAAADVAVACMSSPRRHANMQPARAATVGASGAASCYSLSIAQQQLSSAAVRLQPGQLAGLLPAQLSVGISNSSYKVGVGQEDEEAAAYEARLVAKVLEMERSMQALESQLMHVGCSDTE